jgi:hypothetical protein
MRRWRLRRALRLAGAFALAATTAHAEAKAIGVWRSKAIIQDVAETGEPVVRIHDIPAATHAEAVLRCQTWLEGGLTMPDEEDITALVMYPPRAVVRCVAYKAQ